MITTTTTTTALDEIDGRIAAAAERAAETFANLPPTRLLSRTDADRNRLVRDGRAMSGALRAILAEHQSVGGVIVNASTLAERDTQVCDTCSSEWPCYTVRLVQSVGDGK
jgi:hypothetical protein